MFKVIKEHTKTISKQYSFVPKGGGEGGWEGEGGGIFGRPGKLPIPKSRCVCVCFGGVVGCGGGELVGKVP